MALVGVSLILQGQTLMREWLYLEPHGHILPSLRHAGTGDPASMDVWEGVPRVVRRVPYRVGHSQYSRVLGQYIMRPGLYNGVRRPII